MLARKRVLYLSDPRCQLEAMRACWFAYRKTCRERREKHCGSNSTTKLISSLNIFITLFLNFYENQSAYYQNLSHGFTPSAQPAQSSYTYDQQFQNPQYMPMGIFFTQQTNSALQQGFIGLQSMAQYTPSLGIQF
jgi:hypothetical protein